MKRSPRALRFTHIKPPHPTRLLALNPLPNPLRQLLPPLLRLVPAAEELALPFPALGLLLPPIFALGVFDSGFLPVGGVHVALGDGRDDFLPGFVSFPGILLLEGGHDERGDGSGAGVVGVDYAAVFAAPLADGEGFGPLAFDGVEDVFLFVGGVQRCGEGVLLARDPAFAGVVDFGSVAGGGGDVSAAVELDEGFAVDETFDVDVGEGDEVGFGMGGGVVWRGEGEEGVADLFDMDCAAEGGLLAVVAFEL